MGNREEVYKAEVECLRKQLAEKNKYFYEQFYHLSRAIELLKQAGDLLYMNNFAPDLQQDIDDFLNGVSENENS